MRFRYDQPPSSVPGTAMILSFHGIFTSRSPSLGLNIGLGLKIDQRNYSDNIKISREIVL